MDNLEREKASKVFNTIWDMTKRYAFIPLDDFLWERFIEESKEHSLEFQQYDRATWKLYRDLFFAVEEYKRAKERERLHGKS